MNAALGAGFAAAFILGILLHEYLTAVVADRLGDKTPRLMRRVNLSIKQHADPLGTYVLPTIFTLAALFNNAFLPVFGWGKRHNLGARGLRNPKRDTILFALVGPAVTLLLAVIAGFVYRQSAAFSIGGAVSQGSFIATFAGGFALVCVFLTVIELLPIPGRDGGRVLQRFLSPHAAMRWEELVQYDVLFLLGIFVIGRLLLGTIVGMGDPVCRLVTGVGCGLLTI